MERKKGGWYAVCRRKEVGPNNRSLGLVLLSRKRRQPRYQQHINITNTITIINILIRT